MRGCIISRTLDSILQQGYGYGAAEESLPDDYAWFRGGLYHRGGNVLLPFLAGNWAWLEDCEEADAPKRAAEWQSQQ